MGLSNIGIFHTIVGIIAIAAAIVSFVKHGKIQLSAMSGKLYFYGTLIASLTALAVSKNGGFNPGHAFSVFIVILAVAAYYLHARKREKKSARFMENFYLSFSFFLSLIPTVNETFTRVPTGHPWAKDISDPLIGKTLLVLLILFIAGSVYQFKKQQKINKSF